MLAFCCCREIEAALAKQLALPGEGATGRERSQKARSFLYLVRLLQLHLVGESDLYALQPVQIRVCTPHD
jgi:hypothetical protein